jgi:hypothetical protein
MFIDVLTITNLLIAADQSLALLLDSRSSTVTGIAIEAHIRAGLFSAASSVIRRGESASLWPLKPYRRGCAGLRPASHGARSRRGRAIAQRAGDRSRSCYRDR